MNILLTSVGRRTYLIDYFKDSLNNQGKIHASNNSYSYSMSHADANTITPSIYDDSYIDFLLNYCKENKIDAVISLFDIDLPVLSKNKYKFEQIGTKIIVSDLHAVNICNDKWQTYKFLHENNIKTPKTFLDLDLAQTALEYGSLSYPVILKPRWGMGSIGIYTAENQEELIILNKKLQKDIFNTYLKFESKKDKDNCVLIQEKINGDEYGLEILNDLEGSYVTTIAKKKIAMRSGETDIAEIIDATPFIPLSKRISETLGHVANLDVDCFLNNNGELYVLEMNCRFGGQYPFSHLAGVNFPRQIIKWLLGEATDKALLTPKIGLKSCKDILPKIM